MPCLRCGSPLSAAAHCGACGVRAGEDGVPERPLTMLESFAAAERLVEAGLRDRSWFDSYYANGSPV